MVACRRRLRRGRGGKEGGKIREEKRVGTGGGKREEERGKACGREFSPLSPAPFLGIITIELTSILIS